MTGRHWYGSLRARVALATGLLLTIALVVAALLLAGWTRRSLTQDVEADLDDQVNEITLMAREQKLTPVLAALGVRTGQVQVFDSGGTMVAASAGLADHDRLNVISPPAVGTTTRATVDGALLGRRAGERFLVIARTIDTPTGAVTLYGVSSLRSADRAVHSLTVSFLAGIPVLLLIAGVLLWRSVSRALAPVETMRREVEEITAASLHRRITPPNSDDEIDHLAHTLNALLDRVDTAAQRERRFAGDASHELRSPLTAARAQLEVGLAYPDRTDWPATAHDVLLEIARLEVLASDLLRLSVKDGKTAHVRRAPVDLAALAREQAAAPTREGITTTLLAPDAPLVVPGDRELIVRAVRNLLSNAARHATSRITLEARPGDGVVTLDVSNDGPAISADQLDAIFQPFTRLDDARAADDGGAGLGLAIARGIAEDHGGSLVALPITEGATFRLTLPTSMPAPASGQP